MFYLTGALPLFAFVAFWALALQTNWRQRHEGYWRPAGEAFLYAAIAWGICVVAFTQGLSVAHALTPQALANCWLAVSVIGVVILLGGVVLARRVGGQTVWREALSPDPLPASSPGKYGGVWTISVIITALVLAITAIVARNTPPNNWDAMTYHLSRVQHWIQNQSVGFYPTNDPRQLFDPPWAEYALLQFQSLTGGDYLANFVQWFSGLGVCVAVPMIARSLGANRAGQGLAMVVAATTPMAILQSASPQNDLVTSFWVVSLVYFALAFVERPNLAHGLAFGLALGLATMTKGTAYVYAGPILLGLAIWLLARLWRFMQAMRPMRAVDNQSDSRVADWSWLGAVALLMLAAVLMLALNGWQFTQNMTAFGSPLGPDGKAYSNQTYAPSALVCNLARDVSLELGVSSPALNLGLYHNVVAVCSAVGVSVNDTRISWTGLSGLPFRINAAGTYEGTANSLTQFGLIALALLVVFALRRLRARREVLAYAALLLAGYALFVVYLRWQPWGARLLLPWVLSGAPLVGVALDRLFARRLTLPLVELALLLLASPYLLTAANAPLVGTNTVFNTPRLSQYFVSGQWFEQPYTDAAWFINHRGCREVGFHSAVEGWEYPFWLLLGPKPYSAHIEQVLVNNPSARYAATLQYQRFQPCAIINITDTGAQLPPSFTFHTLQYQLSWSQSDVAIYLPNTPAAP